MHSILSLDRCFILTHVCNLNWDTLFNICQKMFYVMNRSIICLEGFNFIMIILHCSLHLDVELFTNVISESAWIPWFIPFSQNLE